MQFRDIIGQEELKRRLVASVAAGRVSHARSLRGRRVRAPAAGGGLRPVPQLPAPRRRRFVRRLSRLPADRSPRASRPASGLSGQQAGQEVGRSDYVGCLPAAVPHGIRPLERLFLAAGVVRRARPGQDARGAISAREADEIIRKLSFKSFEAEYKVMLVWLPETMNEEAANKILKILEEPWEKTVFLLVSEAPDRLLQTILSRTQEVAVPRISTEVLEAVAARHGQSDPARLHNLARLAGGDYLTLQRLLAGEDDELTRDCFRTVLLAHAAELQRQTPRTGVVGRGGGASLARTAAGVPAPRGASAARELHAPRRIGRHQLPVGRRSRFLREVRPLYRQRECGVPARRDRTGDASDHAERQSDDRLYALRAERQQTDSTKMGRRLWHVWYF